MPLDVALLGCSHPHVPDLLGVVAAEPSLRLAAAWDADPSAVPMAIDGAAVPRAETAVRRADVVVVCAPTDQRPAPCLEAARAGRPLLTEPPVARTAAEARVVGREVQRTRTPAVATLFLRELPALGRLAGLLRERVLGRVASVSATFAHPGATDDAFDGPAAWMRDQDRAGVGGFGDRALHLLDLLGVLSGGEPPRLAAVTLDRPAGSRGDIGGAGVGTWMGTPLSVRAGWAARPGGLELLVAGSAGTATLRGGTLELARDGGEPERWIGAPPHPGEALRAFAARVAARRLPADGLLGAVRAQERLEAALLVG